MNRSSLLTEESAYNSVPEALYIHMALMYGGSDILDVGDEEEREEDVNDKSYNKATKMRRQILDTCQDIV